MTNGNKRPDIIDAYTSNVDETTVAGSKILDDGGDGNMPSSGSIDRGVSGRHPDVLGRGFVFGHLLEDWHLTVVHPNRAVCEYLCYNMANISQEF